MPENIDCYIPARIGSLRVPVKNLRILGDRPLIAHSIAMLQNVRTINAFYVNTEDVRIAQVASRYGAKVYKRDRKLATSEATTDDILYDFSKNSEAEHILIVNPTAPFLRSETLEAASMAYLEGNGSLFSTSRVRRHAMMANRILNFDVNGKSPRTQELTPIDFINFIFIFVSRSLMIERYEKDGFCLHAGSMRQWPLEGRETWDIDDESDFLIAQIALAQTQSPPAEYAPEISDLVRSGVNFSN